jgi:hypothetical protein
MKIGALKPSNMRATSNVSKLIMKEGIPFQMQLRNTQTKFRSSADAGHLYNYVYST